MIAIKIEEKAWGVGDLCLVFLRYEGGVEDYDSGVFRIVVGY